MRTAIINLAQNDALDGNMFRAYTAPMLKLTLIVLAFLTACAVGDNDVPQEALQCRADASSTCERIGYGDNETCYLAFAQRCSLQDAEDAHELCMSAPGATEPCMLRWR